MGSGNDKHSGWRVLRLESSKEGSNVNRSDYLIGRDVLHDTIKIIRDSLKSK